MLYDLVVKVALEQHQRLWLFVCIIGGLLLYVWICLLLECANYKNILASPPAKQNHDEPFLMATKDGL